MSWTLLSSSSVRERGLPLVDEGTPVTIGASRDSIDTNPLAVTLGHSAGDVVRLHMAVLDREDRLESGSGEWLTDFRADDSGPREAVRAAALRSLHLASDSLNFAILETLSEAAGTPVEEIAAVTGLGRMPLAERIADLVSAGLAVKLPEANQVAGTAVGSGLVGLVRQAAAAGARVLVRDG